MKCHLAESCLKDCERDFYSGIISVWARLWFSPYFVSTPSTCPSVCTLSSIQGLQKAQLTSPSVFGKAGRAEKGWGWITEGILFYFVLQMLSFFPPKIYLFIWVHCSCLRTHQKKASDLITDGCEPPCGCWELTSVPPEEKSVLLTAEPSLQPGL